MWRRPRLRDSSTGNEQKGTVWKTLQKSAGFCNSLEQIRKRKGTRGPSGALRKGSDLGSMLNFTHKEGIIHFYIDGEKIIELLVLKEPETQFPTTTCWGLLLNLFIWENALQIKSINTASIMQEQLSGWLRTYFSISCSLKAHSFLSIAFIILLLFSDWTVSFREGRVASQARFSRARSIISTSGCPAGRPRPGG